MIGVADLDSDYAGPLAGFAGAIAYLKTQARPPELLVSVAVDTPFLPADYVARLVDKLGEAPAAVAAYGGQPYPTNSIWRIGRFRDLPEHVAGRDGAAEPQIAVRPGRRAPDRVAGRGCRRSLRQRQYAGGSGGSGAARGCRGGYSQLSFRDRKFGLGKGKSKPLHGRCFTRGTCSAVAQLVEHSTVNRMVLGSSPSRGANSERNCERRAPQFPLHSFLQTPQASGGALALIP